EPGARQASRPLTRPVLAAVASPREGWAHRRARHAAQCARDRITDTRVRDGVAREPSPRERAAVRSDDRGAPRSARVPFDEWHERLFAAHRCRQHRGVREIHERASAATACGAIGEHELRAAHEKIHDAPARGLEINLVLSYARTFVRTKFLASRADGYI